MSIASSKTTSKKTNSVSSSCSVLVSVPEWSVTLLLISSYCLGIADGMIIYGVRTGYRNIGFLDNNIDDFRRIGCKGVYEHSIFGRPYRICEDCYDLFHIPELRTLCRRNCFTTDYFKGCVDVLLLGNEEGEIQSWIKQLHGADPGF